jgi:hypothetical protein
VDPWGGGWAWKTWMTLQDIYLKDTVGKTPELLGKTWKFKDEQSAKKRKLWNYSYMESSQKFSAKQQNRKLYRWKFYKWQKVLNQKVERIRKDQEDEGILQFVCLSHLLKNWTWNLHWTKNRAILWKWSKQGHQSEFGPQWVLCK